MWTVLLWSVANAGSGPWVPGTSVGNLYLGIDGEHFNKVASNDGGELTPVDIGDGVGAVGAQAILSYGIAPRVEVEGRLPYRAAHVNREDHPACQLFADDACAPTHTIGVLEARIKGLILDELSGQPLSLALGGVVRFGGLTSTTRYRITNAGEGTTDVGPRLALGRSGLIGNSYYGVSADLIWLYRVPNTRSFPNLFGEQVVPGSEFHADLDVLITPGGGSITFGPYSSTVWRPGGYDFSDLVLDDPDRFTALRIFHTGVGAKLLVRDAKNHVFVMSAGRTAYAWNNPRDRWSVSFGVSVNDVFRVFERKEG